MSDKPEAVGENSVFRIERPAPALMKYYTLMCLMTGPLFPILIVPNYFRYHTLRYRFDREGISMRWGILFRREVNLTYSRIQDIHLTSNIVERWLGLARIQVQTASGSSSAEMTIEGLHEFEHLRDFLYSRMRGHGEKGSDTFSHDEKVSDPISSALLEAAASLGEAAELISVATGPPLMLAPLKRLVIRFAKVPAEPHTPAGSPGSVRTFRAAENYWKYLLVKWGLKQAVGGFFVFFFAVMSQVWIDGLIASPLVRRETARTEAAPPSPSPSPSPTASPTAESKRKRGRRDRRPPFTEKQVRCVGWAIAVVEIIGVGTFLVQVPLSLAVARLDFEMRWYIVTDRSLRIREGIMGVREMTLTFANVQNISVRQGPLQRILGIADVVVRTAGGGGSAEEHGEGGGSLGKSMHIGKLRAVDNAAEVRDLILERLKRYRDAGLGDPDDAHARHPAPPSTLAGAIALRDAARALLASLK